MSTSNGRPDGADPPSSNRTYFEQQRAALVNEVATNLEDVLQNMNKLNRSLEGIIAVGTEFSQVEGLWSQFENVMAKPEDVQKEDASAPAASEAKGT